MEIALGVNRREDAAVLVADIAGYSRLMGIDEEGTLAALRAMRQEVTDPTIAKYGGAIVKSMGDGLLVKFDSSVYALSCALEVQPLIRGYNTGLPTDKKLEYRIGIHSDDIIIEDNDIQGDGVNIASRLQSVANTGGICISEAVYQRVFQKIDALYVYGGEPYLHNIDHQEIHVYHVFPSVRIARPSPALPLIESSPKPIRSTGQRWNDRLTALQGVTNKALHQISHLLSLESQADMKPGLREDREFGEKMIKTANEIDKNISELLSVGDLEIENYRRFFIDLLYPTFLLGRSSYDEFMAGHTDAAAIARARYFQPLAIRVVRVLKRQKFSNIDAQYLSKLGHITYGAAVLEWTLANTDSMTDMLVEHRIPIIELLKNHLTDSEIYDEEQKTNDYLGVTHVGAAVQQAENARQCPRIDERDSQIAAALRCVACRHIHDREFDKALPYLEESREHIQYMPEVMRSFIDNDFYNEFIYASWHFRQEQYGEAERHIVAALLFAVPIRHQTALGLLNYMMMKIFQSRRNWRGASICRKRAIFHIRQGNSRSFCTFEVLAVLIELGMKDWKPR